MNTEAVKTIEITISTDSLFDGWDAEELACIDTEASADLYAELVTEAVKAAYPEAAVTVAVEGIRDVVRVNGWSGGAPGHEGVINDLRELEADVYDVFAWIVYQKKEAMLDALTGAGLYYERPDGVTVSAKARGDAIYLTYHKGRMPAHESKKFEDVTAALDAIEKIARPQEWRIREWE